MGFHLWMRKKLGWMFSNIDLSSRLLAFFLNENIVNNKEMHKSTNICKSCKDDEKPISRMCASVESNAKMLKNLYLKCVQM
jgi:hypothetical protein